MLMVINVSGPYGIKLLNETLMWHIQSQVTELRKLVLVNKEILIALRTNFDKPDIMKELFKRLQNVDSVLQRMTIIGVILCFRELLQEALSSQLEERIPFLTSSIKDFHCHAGSPHESSLVAELASACGYSSKVRSEKTSFTYTNVKLRLRFDVHLIFT